MLTRVTEWGGVLSGKNLNAAHWVCASGPGWGQLHLENRGFRVPRLPGIPGAYACVSEKVWTGLPPGLALKVFKRQRMLIILRRKVGVEDGEILEKLPLNGKILLNHFLKAKAYTLNTASSLRYSVPKAYLERC